MTPAAAYLAILAEAEADIDATPADRPAECSACGREFPDAGQGFSMCSEHEQWQAEYDAWLQEKRAESWTATLRGDALIAIAGRGA